MVIFYVLAGLVGGILGGMGMGGGTLLIPLLTLFLDVSQKSAQAYNLVSFIPMAVVALFLHKKQGLIKPQNIGFIIIPAVISAVGGALLAVNLDSDFLKKGFGVFLIVLGIIFFVGNISKKEDEKESKKSPKSEKK